MSTYFVFQRGAHNVIFSDHVEADSAEEAVRKYVETQGEDLIQKSYVCVLHYVESQVTKFLAEPRLHIEAVK